MRYFKNNAFQKILLKGKDACSLNIIVLCSSHLYIYMIYSTYPSPKYLHIYCTVFYIKVLSNNIFLE